MEKPAKKGSHVAGFIAMHIERVGKTQCQIAKEVGWKKPNVVTMIKQGSMPLPLEKIGPLARSLGVNSGLLFWLVMHDYYRKTLRQLMRDVPGIMIDPREQHIIAAYRKLTGGDSSLKEVTISDGKQTIRVPVEPLE